MTKWILASASPRRKELMSRMRAPFQVIPSNAEEVITESDPKEAVKRLAKLKASDVAVRCLESREYIENGKEDTIILGADTVVVYEGRILGKPKDKEDAKRMLSMLSGKTHQVYTGVSLIRIPMMSSYTFCQRTDVTMYHMSPEDIEYYVNTGEPMDKAGAYGIQGMGGIYVKKINGDYNNVVGLPIARLCYDLGTLEARGWSMTPEIEKELEQENEI